MYTIGKGGEIMKLIDIRIALLRKTKTMTWLAQQLDYSTTYLYQVIEVQNKKELDRIKNILEGE